MARITNSARALSEKLDPHLKPVVLAAIDMSPIDIDVELVEGDPRSVKLHSNGPNAGTDMAQKTVADSMHRASHRYRQSIKWSGVGFKKIGQLLDSQMSEEFDKTQEEVKDLDMATFKLS